MQLVLCGIIVFVLLLIILIWVGRSSSGGPWVSRFNGGSGGIVLNQGGGPNSEIQKKHNEEICRKRCIPGEECPC